MAQEFPVSLNDFFRSIGLITTTIHLSDTQSRSQTRGGQSITMNVGNRLWHGNVTVVPAYHGLADQMVAKVERLLSAEASFLVSHSVRKGPQADPNGAKLVGFNPTLSGLSTNNVELAITGLPEGYKITQGDFIELEASSAPVKQLYRAYSTATAVNGAIADLEVIPRIEPQIALGSSVKLVNASVAAKIIPGSYSPPTQENSVTSSFSFEWVQSHL